MNDPECFCVICLEYASDTCRSGHSPEQYRRNMPYYYADGTRMAFILGPSEFVQVEIIKLLRHAAAFCHEMLSPHILSDVRVDSKQTLVVVKPPQNAPGEA